MIKPKDIFEENEVRKKTMLAIPMQDDQTGLYIRNAFVQKNVAIAPFDLLEESLLGFNYMNDKFNDDLDRLSPDFVLIAKGLHLNEETIKKAKEKTKVIYWMFDHTLGGLPIIKQEKYLNAIRHADTYYTVVRGDVEELIANGVNAKWLPEAASTQFNYPVPLNFYEIKKYGADVTFCGSIGTKGYHEDRLSFLDMILQSKIKLKIYGEVPNQDLVPKRLMFVHQKVGAINDFHNTVVGASKINLGRSGWSDVDMAMSARTYRVLASEGFHLTNATKGIETMFTSGKHLDTYTTNLDCLKKIKYWLELPEERAKIANAGMKEVIDKHTFHHRVEEILGDLK